MKTEGALDDVLCRGETGFGRKIICEYTTRMVFTEVKSSERRKIEVERCYSAANDDGFFEWEVRLPGCPLYNGHLEFGVEQTIERLESMKRPFEVTVLGWLFIVVGIASTVYHVWKGSLDRWIAPILLVGAIAVVAGIFLLRGARWARWLILAWLAFHVVVGALNSLQDALPHLVLFLVVGYFLLGPPTSKYFHSSQVG